MNHLRSCNVKPPLKSPLNSLLNGLLLAALSMLVACGGGGGSADPATTAADPNATAAPDPAAPAPAPSPAPPTPAPPPPSEPPAPPPAATVDPQPSGPGRLTAASALNRIAAADIAQAVATATAAGDHKVPPVAPVYDVANHRISYLTQDGQGRTVTASGLVSVPVKSAGARSPVVSYQHGTIFKDAEAPSNHATADEAAVILASLGYIVVAPDYVGYGVSRGAEHPYLLAAPAASAVLDLLTAAKHWRSGNAVADNGQLFLVGYSEGGYVTMAAHRAMQAGSNGTANPHLATLVAAVPGAGPYHVGVTMDELLRRVKDEHPVIGALISPGFLKNLGSTVRKEVRRLLLRLIVPDDADVTMQSTFIDTYMADDEAGMERQSNVHDWRPDAPVGLFHGRDDQTVPYAAAARTLQAMQASAAPQVSLTDCAATPSDHLPCVVPYWEFMLGKLGAWARDL
jgi:pimeloyl-ACP methyl ester carboxylesterase